MDLISGLHHLTACVNGAQEDVDFYTKIIGQRLVKQTVLLDGEKPVYHLYYANETGTPGTVMTTFPYKQLGIYGRRGTGQVKITSFSVPTSSMSFWSKRFEKYNVQHSAIKERFGQPNIHFVHPSGLEFEMIGDDNDSRPPWTTPETPADVAVRGLHSVTLSLRETTESEGFMEVLGFKKTAQEGSYQRFGLREGGAGRSVDFLHEPDVPAGTWTFGAGTVHHIAFAVVNDEEQKQVKDYLEGLGYTDVSEQKNRNYFHSIYFRMPGGVLFEVATSDIGFTVDEPQEKMGQRIQFPPWFEDRRDEYLAQLEHFNV
ncbi:MAG TPA: ring-cleaving dioxygenase [Ktedonobacteraceae bacterium]|nr:ring-cleaving dioxygenase [Ktedonobacteraceae bacterium]